MHRALLLLVPLAACATRDVHRSEPLVARATCSGDGYAVFGYPMAQEAGCGERVVNLGDGCYFATRPGEQVKTPRQVLHGPGGTDTHWAPHLYECAANSPDGHVACVQDQTLPTRDSVFGEHIMFVGWWLRLPNQVGKTWPSAWFPATGRCRDKLEAWELANLPPPDRLALISTYWHVDSMGDRDPPRQRILPVEDPISLGRILGPEPLLRGRACPTEQGIDVQIENDVPAQLERKFEAMVERGLSHHAIERCTRVEVGLAFADVDGTEL